MIQGDTWTGETWFRVNKPPAQPATTTPKTTEQTEKAQQAPQVRQQPTALQLLEQDGTTQQVSRDPPFRHTTKKPAPTTTAIPDPSTMTPTTDYWIREGHYWKRVHVQVRTTMYVPQQTDHGPDIGRLKQTRTTFVNRTEQGRGYTIHDNWHESGARQLDRQWTGSTNFKEEAQYKYEYDTDIEDESQQAQRAKGMKAPQQPTRQERLEHELTHSPYRSWCPICVKSKGRADNHPKQASKQPAIQVDFTYIHESIWRQTSTTSTGSNRGRIRHGNGSSCTRQEPTTTIPDTMSTNIHVRMWTSTSNTINHNTTIRPRRVHTEPIAGRRTKARKQRQHPTITGILVTITRKH